jgi:two-component system, response regulator PdtaR
VRVLIVEDDMVIAGGLAPMVTGLGHELVGLAADRDTAIALIRSSDIDLALVDLRLSDGWTGLDVARAARENGVAVVFATADPALAPDDLAGAAGLIEKPYAQDGIKAVLAYLGAEIAGGEAPAPPRCLRLPLRISRAEPRRFVDETSRPR